MSSTVRSTDRRRIVPAVLVLALAAATIALGLTGALFTDSASIGNNSFTTGDVTLGTSPTDVLFDVSAMAPGDTDGAHDVTVTNSGSLEYRYAVTSTSDDDNLAAELDLWVWDEAEEDDGVISGTAGTCDATPGNGNITTFIYEQGVLGSTGGTNVVGDPTKGQQAGDRVLAASGSEVLCLFVELPDGTGNEFENTTTGTTFAFEAEQTASNP